MLDPFAQLFQHCWGHARSLRMVYKDLWVVSFPRCTAGPNIVGSCCIRSHTTANTHVTTPNIVGATMLGVVASVCTQLIRKETVLLHSEHFNHICMSSENVKILLAYKLERNVTKHSLNRASVLLL